LLHALFAPVGKKGGTANKLHSSFYGEWSFFIYFGCVKGECCFLNSVDWSGRREDSCGSSWTGETPQELATRRLTASPAESEAPGTEINSQG
jgi:hypothetical protein